MVERAILVHLPKCRPLWARTIKDARLRTFGITVDLFIADVIMPDGSGLDFLFEASTVHPRARAIVLTAVELPEFEQKSHLAGAIRFAQKPIATPKLIEMISQSLSDGAKPADASPSSKAFQASLKDLTPFDLIQLKCLSSATTIMEFTSGENIGLLFFEKGEIIHAQSGELQGLDALQAVVSWRAGTAHELGKGDFGSPPRTIEIPWQHLLMQVAQTTDEAAGSAA